MEIADIFVINKSDRAGVEKTGPGRDNALLSLAHRRRWLDSSDSQNDCNGRIRNR